MSWTGFGVRVSQKLINRTQLIIHAQLPCPILLVHQLLLLFPQELFIVDHILFGKCIQ